MPTPEQQPSYPTLASPLQIGPMHLRNRIVLLPHGAGFADSRARLPTTQHVDYYHARAAGGAGLICTESMLVSRDCLLGWAVLASDPAVVDGYRRIADAVHRHESAICGQLSHMGNQSMGVWGRAPLIGPSALPDPMFREPAKPMDRADMDRVLADYVAGARNLAAAGFDAVEVKAAHDGLLHQFLSPLTNDRADEFGGAPENKLRYVLEVIRAIRAEVGSGVAVGVRLLIDECFPGGYGLEEGLVYAKLIEASGVVDYITTDIGILTSMDKCAPGMGVPEGSAEYAYSATAAKLSLPVIAFGGIVTPEYAEHVVATGKAAAIGMARQLIADPDWPSKALNGRTTDIRPCTHCNELCIGAVGIGMGVGCTINPWVGYGEAVPQSSDFAGQRVVIVGAGPAGLESAIALARANAEVTVIERAAAAGGRLAVAARMANRSGWTRYIDWLVRQARAAGVEIRFGVDATTNLLLRFAPDAVVVAAGSTSTASALSGALSIDEFYTWQTIKGRLAFIDEGAAGMPLWSSSLHAAEQGVSPVCLIVPAPMVGMGLDPATMATFYPRLQRSGLDLRTDRVAISFHAGVLTIANPHTGAHEQIEVDHVIASTRRQTAGSDLFASLAGQVRVVRVGDALVPRDHVVNAVREGQTVGVALEHGETAMGLVRRSHGERFSYEANT